MGVWYVIVEARQTVKTWLATLKSKESAAPLFTAVPTSSLWRLAGSMQPTTLDFTSTHIAPMMHLYWFYNFMMTSTVYRSQTYLQSIFPRTTIVASTQPWSF